MAEKYAGVKFSCKLSKRKLGEYPAEINALIAAGTRLAAAGLAHANEGNISVRVSSGFLIKASGTNLGELGKDDFALVTYVDAKEFSITAEGPKTPSSEAMTHYAIYAARPDAMAIAHAHDSKRLAKVEELGIPITQKEASYGTPENAGLVSQLMKKHDFVAARGHGFFSLGKTIDEAVGRFL